MIFSDVICPVKFSYARILLGPNPKILDIGCGNDSSNLTRKWFKDCYYVGVDIQGHSNTEDSLRKMDEFIIVGSDGDGYNKIPDDYFDFIIMNHVAEHMMHPLETIAILSNKLKRGGKFWIAFPSLRSLELPPATQWCSV